MIRENFREYLDQLLNDGYSVRHDEHLSDPDLIDPGGNPVETWREDYPYDERLDRDVYEEEKYQLQIELLKFQYWAQDTGTKHLILFEGRDAAGKGGTIKRFMEHLNPRGARVVALEKPTERERTQWYFQRYVHHLPAHGEMVMFDRSWYNRAGVERVMGFCTAKQHAEFIRQVPLFEQMLVNDGISLTPGSPSGRSTRSGSGNCRRRISHRWTTGTTTPRPRKTCSRGRTPRSLRGPWSRATTRSAHA